MPVSPTRVHIRFSCGHLRWFTNGPPITGAEVYCLSCQDVVTVAEGIADHRWQCASCRANRRHGTAEARCVQALSKHLRSHPDHRVKRYNGELFLEEIGSEGLQPLFGDLTGHQQSLRAVIETRPPRDPTVT